MNTGDCDNKILLRSAAFEQNAEPMLILDADRKIADLNTAAADLAGRPVAEILGMTCNQFYRCERGGHHCMLGRVFENKTGYCLDHKIVLPGGDEIEVSVGAAPLIDEAGVIIGAVEVVRRMDEIAAGAGSELLKQSLTDPLTGLWNRRKLFESMEIESSRAARHGRPFSLLIADIDNFKDYNDKFGHIEGDTALRFVADVLSGGIRKEDLVSRYGGEEFVVLLPETGAGGAAVQSERLRTAVSELSAAEKSLKKPITVSLGVASCPAGGRCEANALLQQADKALYAAKRAGKNRVVSFDSIRNQ